MNKNISQYSHRIGLAAIALVFISSLVYATTWGDGFEWLGVPRASAENAVVKISETMQPLEVTSPLVPTLGTYPNTMVELSASTTVMPNATPTMTTRINVSTNTNFKGTLVANPTTGVVRAESCRSLT